MLVNILSDIFPDSKICLDKVSISENINSFAEKFCNLCEKFDLDNYMDITWNIKIKDFDVHKATNEEIFQIIASTEEENQK